MPQDLTYEKISSAEAFAVLQEDWHRLFNQMGASNIFLDYHWVRIWWECHGADKELAVYVVRKDRRVIGIAPLMLLANSAIGVSYCNMYLLTAYDDPHAAEGVSDELDFLWDPACEDQKVHFAGYLLSQTTGWCYLRLQCLRRDSGTLQAFYRAAQDLSLEARQVHEMGVPALEMEGSWDDYYAGRSSKFRKLVRRAFRDVAAEHVVTTVEYRTREEVEQGLTEVTVIERSSWKSRQGISLEDERLNHFYHKVVRFFAGRQQIRLWVLKVDARPVAYDLYIENNGSLTVLKGSYDSDYARFSPGTLLTYTAKQHFFEQQIRRVDMMSGSLHYKQKWTNSLHTLVGISIRRAGLLPSLIDFWLNSPPLRKVRKMRGRWRRRIRKVFAKMSVISHSGGSGA